MFKKYFYELKNRSMLIIISWFMTILTSYNYKETLLFLLIKVNSNLYDSNIFYFISTNLTDVFTVYLQLVYFISSQILIIFTVYHIIIFISPALYNFEYKKIINIIYMSLFVILFCLYFIHKVILPILWLFFLNYNNTNIFFEAKINEYFEFYKTIYYILVLIGFCFIFIYLFIDFINNKLKFIKNFRKSFYLFFLILATIITPPDIISQFLFGFFSIFCYELIIITIIIKFFLN